MHDFVELLFHAIAGLLRALWAACEFVLQLVADMGIERLVEASFEGRGKAKSRSGRRF